MFKMEKLKPGMFLLPKERGMKVPGLVIANEAILSEIDIEQPIEQVKNVAYLPGIVGYSIAMPDIHWGYGFPIGGVAAMDAETGVISPGGVGYDINCGVRLAVAPGKLSDLSEKTKNELINHLFQLIPSGVGHGHRGSGLSDSDYKKLVERGARWSIEQGFGFLEDLSHIESAGLIEGGDIDAVSDVAKERGRKQLGSIGSGNHFVEIGEIQKIYLPEVAARWNIEQGQIYILIHSGSRGFGHQVCQDNLDSFVKRGYAEGLPDRQLVAAPIKSAAGESYFRGMAAAANFAFNNRQRILHYAREGFRNVCGFKPENIHLIYDVCHNIAKFETHEVEGVKKNLCVHRKGATRAFKDQPVIVPGDMGRSSHLMIGLGNPKTWCSCCHGAGRARSRVQSMKAWKKQDPRAYMKEHGVIVKASSYRTIAEEMPDAYKNVDTVVEAVQEAGLANMVARLKPALVLKG